MAENAAQIAAMSAQLQAFRQSSGRDDQAFLSHLNDLASRGLLPNFWTQALPDDLRALYEASGIGVSMETYVDPGAVRSGELSEMAGTGEEGEALAANMEQFGLSDWRPIGVYERSQGRFEDDPDSAEGQRWVSYPNFTPFPMSQQEAGFTTDAESPLPFVAKPGSAAERYVQERLRDIDASISAGAQYQPAQLKYGQLGTDPTSFVNRWGRQQSQFRNKGQFARQAKQLSSQELDAVVAAMKDALLENYDRLIGHGHGGEQTTALRNAVMHSKATEIQNDEKGFSITLPLPDEPGIERAGSSAPRPDTGVYGKYVFQGRPGIRAKSMAISGKTRTGKEFQRSVPGVMRFRMHGQWITTRNVRPSRTDLNIYEMNAGQRAKIAERIQAVFVPMVQSDLAQAGAE